MVSLNYKKIPNCLRKYRMTRGLKQKDVAKILGLRNTSVISRWEKGVSFPNPKYLFRLAVLYRTMVDALFIDLIRFLRKDLQKKETSLQRRK